VTVIKSHSMLTSLVVVDLTLSLCGLIFISMVTSRSLAVRKDVISSGLAVMLGRRHAGSRPSIPSCTRHEVTTGSRPSIPSCTRHKVTAGSRPSIPSCTRYKVTAGSRPSIPSCTRHKVTAGHTSVIINCTSGAFHIYNRFVEKIVKNTEN